MFKLTLEQQNKYKEMYLQWLQEENITIDDYKEFVADYTTIKNTVNAFIDEFYNTKLEKTKENIIEYVYNKLKHIICMRQQQKLEEVKHYEYWDIDFNTITITISINDNTLEVSNFFNGYPKNSDDIFEDIEINILEQIVDK